MTMLMFLATVAYLLLAIVGLTTPVAMEVFLWGGLILILGWWFHDWLFNRREAAA